MNRSIAPNIININNIHTGFPDSANNVFRINSNEGVFKLDIIYPNGGYAMLQNKFQGIMAMDLLLSGTDKLTAQKISESLDALGAYVYKSCDYYASSLSLYGLIDNFDKILKIVKDCIEHCNFPHEEIDVYKNKRSKEHQINLEKTGYLANRQINWMLFGNKHPYGQAYEKALYDAIDQSALKAFVSNQLNQVLYVYTGPESFAIEAALSDNHFPINPLAEPQTEEALPMPQSHEEWIHKTGSTQNSLRFGKQLPGRTHSDYYALTLFNLVLGGFFGSRLMKNIREDKGLTYGIHSSITPFKTYSIFKISSECNNSLTDVVKTEILNEIKVLQTELIGEEELNIAKNYFKGALLRNFDGAFNIADRFKASIESGASKTYYEDLFKQIDSIPAEMVKTIANNYFDTESLNYCVAGEK